MNDGLSPEELRLIATFVGAVFASGIAAFAGYRKGKPTAAATAGAIQAASCRAVDFAPEVREVRRDVARLSERHDRLVELIDGYAEEVRGMRDILVRIEDRTAR